MATNAEHIENYFNNKLAEKERLDVEKKIKSDKDFAQEAEEFALLFNSFDEMQAEELLTQFDKVEKDLENQGGNNIGLPVYFRWAAVFIFLVTVSLWFYLGSSTSNQELFLTYYAPYPNVENPVSRSGADADNVWKLYENQEYEEAYLRFEEILSKNPDEIATRFYWGICALELNRLEQAEMAFGTIVSQNDSRFFEQAQWYLALAYLKGEKEVELHRALEEIQEAGTSYSSKAKELADALN